MDLFIGTMCLLKFNSSKINQYSQWVTCVEWKNHEFSTIVKMTRNYNKVKNYYMAKNVPEFHKAALAAPLKLFPLGERDGFGSKGLVDRIARLRAKNFDKRKLDINQRYVLLEKINKNDPDNYDPIDVNEAHVQALRYLHGMNIMANHVSDPKQKSELSDLTKIIKAYEQKVRENNTGYTADNTSWLTDQLAHLIAKTLNISIKHAHLQLTMARDLGIMLEHQPVIMTRSETDTNTVIEQSTPIKVGKEYYNKYIPENINDQLWFQSAKKFAGFQHDTKDTWLEKFFHQQKNNLAKNGVAAPPSARWLPIPANIQKITLNVKNNETKAVQENNFIRVGISSAYDIRKLPKGEKKYAYQKEIGKEMLVEIIKSQLSDQIDLFKKSYGNLYDKLDINSPPFYVNYQTLLSPLLPERHFNHVDNNTRFVDMAKEIMVELQNDKNSELYVFAKAKGVDLKITHTNSAINRNAWMTRSYKEDKVTRMEKISNFESLKEMVVKEYGNLDKFYATNPGLKNEFELRIKACENLKDLLNREPPYDKLKRYQRNIMQAALENLTMGSQALNLAGCKSARDRTAVFACAVKTMIENPAAMRDYAQLKEGIITSLKQGHHFRSMNFHTAIVKVALVHKEFMKGLAASTQQAIKELLIFSKKTHAYKEPKVKSGQAKVKMFDRDTAKEPAADVPINAPQRDISKRS